MRDPQKWPQLLRTAAAEFAEHGYDRASLNRVIRDVGMSKSSFYHAVPSKQALYDAVLDELGPALVAAVAPPETAGLETDFWGELEAAAERLARAGQQDPVFWQLGRMWYLPGAPAGSDSAMGRAAGQVAAWVERAVETGRRVGAVRDDLPSDLQVRLALAVVQVLDEWAITNLAGAGAADGDTLAEAGRAPFAVVRRLLAPA